jgi:MFS family permease
LPASAGQATSELKALFSKIVWRLMPFLALAHAISAIDRLNISFAKLRMAQDIGLNDTVYGLGAGIFYLGYLLFEVPSNLYLQRVGARATLMRIMMIWGVITLATAFVTTPSQLLVARFLLGVAEAGFFPGVILYLTYWFPAALRGRVTAVFMTAAVAAGVASGPLAGWIMTQYEGWMGLHGWQALFIFEGIPAVLLGLLAWIWLADKPEDARWLSASEKQAIAAALAAEPSRCAPRGRLIEGLRDPHVYIAGAAFFCVYSATNTVGYWMPTLIRGLGIDSLRTIGMLASLPFALAIVGMYVLGRSSDKRLERRWHTALTMLVSAGCFFLIGLVPGNVWLSMSLVTLGAAASMCAISLFWTIPPTFLSPTSAVGGIAMISSLGNLAGVVSQFAVGAIKTATGSLYLAFDVIGAIMVLGALILLIAIPARSLRVRGDSAM